LADISGQSFLQRKLDELRRNHITHAVLLVGHGGTQVQSFIDTTELPIDVTVIRDEPSLLGTGGSLLRALPRLPDDFYLTYGDSLLDLEYHELEAARNSSQLPCALAVTFNVGPADVANCMIDGDRVVRHNKLKSPEMTAMDYGLMLLNKDWIERVSDNLVPPCDLSVILGRLASAGQLAAHPTRQAYWEIGTPLSLETVRRHFAEDTEVPEGA
jgi:NDP-sugar pyrophosphorylase family protein